MLATIMSYILAGIQYLAAAGGAVVVAGLGALYMYQRKLVYPADFVPEARTAVPRPDEFGLAHWDSLSWVTPDGVRITGYLIKRATDAETRAAPTILFLHANAGNMGHRLPIAAVLHRELGCNIVMLSYRGYGLSEGSPSEAGLQIDAKVALDFITEHPELDESQVVVYGQSLGGAVAIYLASTFPEKVKAVMIENTFLSIPKLVPHLLPYLSAVRFACSEQWPSEDRIKKIRVPILFLSGTHDEIVPAMHMHELHASCPSPSKYMTIFPNGTHNDTCVKEGYFEAIKGFWAAHVAN